MNVESIHKKINKAKRETMHNPDIGYLITLVGGAMFFIDEKDYQEDPAGKINVKGDKCFQVHIFPDRQPGRLLCNTSKLCDLPTKVKEITIYKQAVMMVERISQDSFVYESIVKSRSNLIIPKGVPVAKEREQ